MATANEPSTRAGNYVRQLTGYRAFVPVPVAARSGNRSFRRVVAVALARGSRTRMSELVPGTNPRR